MSQKLSLYPYWLILFYFLKYGLPLTPASIFFMLPVAIEHASFYREVRLIIICARELVYITILEYRYLFY